MRGSATPKWYVAQHLHVWPSGHWHTSVGLWLRWLVAQRVRVGRRGLHRAAMALWGDMVVVTRQVRGIPPAAAKTALATYSPVIV
jgi:hypothetical protein